MKREGVEKRLGGERRLWDIGKGKLVAREGRETKRGAPGGERRPEAEAPWEGRRQAGRVDREGSRTPQ